MEEMIMKKKLATMVLALICVLTPMQVKAIAPENFELPAGQERQTDVMIQVNSDEVTWEDGTTETIVTAYYMVTKENETLSSIASRLQLTEEYLLSANPDFKWETNEPLAKGAYLELPEVDWNVLTDVYYLVKKGDCLNTISEYFYTKVDEIVTLNSDIKNPNLIYVGQVIRIK